jgi:hypothetical protein
VSGFPRFSSDPVILARQIDHLSRLAMIPAPTSDHETVDRWFDARAEAIHPDENYPPLEEDLHPNVTRRIPREQAPPVTNPRPDAPPLSSSTGRPDAGPQDASSPRGSNARAA